MKTIKQSLLNTIILYLIVYLVVSFTLWEFVNPFQWIIDIPEMEATNRFLLLFAIICYWAINIVAAYKYFNPDKPDK